MTVRIHIIFLYLVIIKSRGKRGGGGGGGGIVQDRTEENPET